jgi:hypothetical protein
VEGVALELPVVLEPLQEEVLWEANPHHQDPKRRMERSRVVGKDRVGRQEEVELAEEEKEYVAE